MVFVISYVLEHGGDDILGPFCYFPRAHTSHGPPVPEEGPTKEGVPSTAARVAMEMRAVV